MQLNLSVQTDKPDLYIDYIEATLWTGEKIAINWDRSYIERTKNGFYAQFVAVNYYDDASEESIYLHAEDIPGISIDEFGLYSDIRGPIYFKLDEMEFEEDGREYILDPSVYSDAGKYSEQDSRIYIIDGQAYRIEKCFDSGIERENEFGETVLCEGYYCQLYNQSYTEHTNEIDNFCLAVGYEIPDLSEEAFENGVKNYLDNKSVRICVYKDALGYNDEFDNLTYIRVPRLWLYRVMTEEGITDNKLWFNEYTADNTEFIARKALADGVIIECSDKNISINNRESLQDKLQNAEQRRPEININSFDEREKER